MKVPGNPYANAPGNDDVPPLVVDVFLADTPVPDRSEGPAEAEPPVVTATTTGDDL